MIRMVIVIVLCLSLRVLGQEFSINNPAVHIKIENTFGYLKVNTITENEKVDFNSEKISYYYHKAYNIFDNAGKEIMQAEKSYNTPGIVKLPEGNYVVIAEVIEGQKDIFEIVIEAGKLFEIDEWQISSKIQLSY